MAHRIVIAGAELADALDAEKAAIVSQSALGFNSEQLCELQRKRSGRGICEIEVVKSMYGYSVRYASGLQDFALLLPARGRADPSLEFAEQFCREWVAAAPTQRFATRWVD